MWHILLSPEKTFRVLWPKNCHHTHTSIYIYIYTNVYKTIVKHFHMKWTMVDIFVFCLIISANLCIEGSSWEFLFCFLFFFSLFLFFYVCEVFKHACKGDTFVSNFILITGCLTKNQGLNSIFIIFLHWKAWLFSADVTWMCMYVWHWIYLNVYECTLM